MEIILYKEFSVLQYPSIAYAVSAIVFAGYYCVIICSAQLVE